MPIGALVRFRLLPISRIRLMSILGIKDACLKAINNYDIVEQKLVGEEHQLILLGKHRIIKCIELVV